MKITIITVCKNAEVHITQTMESVLSQTGDFEFEYIIIDGLSIDTTAHIVGRFADRRIKFISEPDSGMYDALAKGLKQASGDVIGYINADDWLLPGALGAVVTAFERHTHIRWLTGVCRFANERGDIESSFLPAGYSRMLIRQGFYGPFLKFIRQESTFFRRELLDAVDLDKLSQYRYAGDFYLWHTFAGTEDLYVLDRALAVFRSRDGQLSGDRSAYFSEMATIRERPSFFAWPAAFFAKVGERFPNAIKRMIVHRMISPDMRGPDA